MKPVKNSEVKRKTGSLKALYSIISKPVKAAGLIMVEKKRVSAESSFKIKLQDYGITGKDIGTVIANNIEIKVNAKYD